MPDTHTNHETMIGPTEHDRPQGTRASAADEISLLDILLVFARNRRLIAGVIAAFTVVGVLLAVFSSNEYTASAKVIREAPAEGRGVSGGLAALRGFGINVGGGATGLSPEAYPDIVQSREVRLAVVRDTFYFGDLARETTFVEYVDESGSLVGRVVSTVKRYTIGLPGLIMSSLRSEPLAPDAKRGGTMSYVSEREADAIRALSGLVSTNVDMETGLMTIAATTGDPYASAGLVDAVLKHVGERVRAIRTEKARMNVAFIQERFKEARQELQQAEEELARFHDRNMNPQTAQLRTELERLQRQVSFKSQLYGELQTQVTQAEIELQRSEPVVTVLEEPVPPMRPSGPRRTLIVLLSVILGTFCGVGAAFVKNVFSSQRDDGEEQGKLDEIRQAFSPPATLVNWVKRRRQLS